MNIKRLLVQDRKGRLWLKERNGGRAREVHEVSTVCKSLGRSRRQIYRDLESGQLLKAGQFLGSLLIDAESVKRFNEQKPFRQPLPKGLQRFFPEYEVQSLNAGTDRVLILSRILDEGGIADLIWIKKRYSERDLRRFLEQDGARLLSSRSLHLWKKVFKIRPRSGMIAKRVNETWQR